jgi:hypothetical protein
MTCSNDALQFCPFLFNQILLRNARPIHLEIFLDAQKFKTSFVVPFGRSHTKDARTGENAGGHHCPYPEAD